MATAVVVAAAEQIEGGAASVAELAVAESAVAASAVQAVAHTMACTCRAERIGEGYVQQHKTKLS